MNLKYIIILNYRAFESSLVSEKETINYFSDSKRILSDGFRSKRPRYSRIHLDSEPAKIGEQVYFIYSIIFIGLLFINYYKILLDCCQSI